MPSSDPGGTMPLPGGRMGSERRGGKTTNGQAGIWFYWVRYVPRKLGWGRKKRQLCALPENCETDAPRRSHGSATRGSDGFLSCKTPVVTDFTPLPKALGWSTVSQPSQQKLLTFPLLQQSFSSWVSFRIVESQFLVGRDF